MLIYVEGKNFLGRTFVLTCDAGDTIGRLKALLLHILHDLGRSDHFFRLRFGDFYLREPLTLKDYNISEMSVLQIVPISFGCHARPETTAGVPRPFTTLTHHKPHTLTNEQGPTHPLSSVGAHTLAALRKEVTIFKRRQHLLQALQAMVWVLLASVIVSFATVYWWSGFWIGLTVVVSLYLMPSYLHVGGTMGRMTKRDKWLIAVYSVVFVIVATVNLVMFVYLLVAVVIERDCSFFPDPASLLGCSHRLWLSLALYPLQALLFLAGSLTAISLLANFTFEAGQLVEPTLTKVKEVKELIQIAEVGSSVKDRRQVAFELSNIALLGGKNKEQIAADGGLQLLTSMMSGDDEVTQEYASEALAEMLSFPADQAPTDSTTIQAEFVSQGGVATLCALLHSANVFIVEKAALSLSYLSSTCLGNRMAVTQERGLDDLQRIFTKSHTEVQLLVGQILMNFAVCDESRPFLLDHGGLVDVMVEAVGMNQLRETVRTSALKALLELGRADNRVILNRPGLVKGLLDIQSLGGKGIHHSCLELLLTFAQDSEGLKQLLVHSDLLSSLQDLVYSATNDRHLALLMLQLVLVMLKARRHRARLISIGVRDLLEELQNKLNVVTAHDSELNNLLAECWLQFNNN